MDRFDRFVGVMLAIIIIIIGVVLVYFPSENKESIETVGNIVMTVELPYRVVDTINVNYTNVRVVIRVVFINFDKFVGDNQIESVKVFEKEYTYSLKPPSVVVPDAYRFNITITRDAYEASGRNVLLQVSIVIYNGTSNEKIVGMGYSVVMEKQMLDKIIEDGKYVIHRDRCYVIEYADIKFLGE